MSSDSEVPISQSLCLIKCQVNHNSSSCLCSPKYQSLFVLTLYCIKVAALKHSSSKEFNRLEVFRARNFSGKALVDLMLVQRPCRMEHADWLQGGPGTSTAHFVIGRISAGSSVISRPLLLLVPQRFISASPRADFTRRLHFAH